MPPRYLLAVAAAVATAGSLPTAHSFSPPPPLSPTPTARPVHHRRRTPPSPLRSSPADTEAPAAADGGGAAYEPPEDAVISIKPKAMARLVELKSKRDADPKQAETEGDPLVLRMGVRNGGCSGLSYVMDFSTEDDVGEEDEVDTYEEEGIRCVVDAKSLLYLYGLELDYSDDLIGGGFKFFNPNAEESCGCGSSFGV